MTLPHSGKALIFSAPSGAGKTTIVRRLLDTFTNLEFSISACSRAKRPNEVDGKDYHFLSLEEFKRKIAANEFLEWEEVYTDLFYGTLNSELERIWAKHNVIIFDVDVLGGLNLKKKLGANALAFFIMPPSIEELEKRLKNRGTETPESLQKRISKAEEEIKYAPYFDTIVENSCIDSTVKLVQTEIETFLKK